jgi:thiamine pyrophosphate-dependent acetolactate synthase large subunit-like protein
LRVLHVIHDNASWGIIRAAQSRFGFDLATGLEGTDYAAIARGFGCHGERLDDPRQIADAFGRAVAAHGPAVLDVVVRFAPHPGLGRFAAIGRSPDHP